MSKLKYNFISAWAILSLVLGPLGTGVAFARTVMVDSGVHFYPTTYPATTTSTNSDTSNSNQNNNTSDTSNTNNNTSSTTNTTTDTTVDNREVTYRNIYLADSIADRFSSQYVDQDSQTIAYQAPSDINSEYGRLAASAVVGSEGFWPSGILQWFIVFILLIVIITLFRYIRGSKENYHASPMKHA